ncbi:MAG: hypothetical protein HKN21_05980, partial [Candidatus Eisenbacteria bacterium]|nr:hypothetical protein [Candidatus Eisenbacteria bacterium]
MNGLLGSLLEKLPPTGRRVVVVMLVCGALGAVWAVAQWASQPMYVALYSDLDYAQAAELEEALKEGGVPTKLGGGGSQVMVPVSETAHARVVLARAGHTPGDRPGLELFDKPAWGMTDFSQRVTFQRALEGELARTVAGIKGVEKAQIHLALPAQSALR